MAIFRRIAPYFRYLSSVKHSTTTTAVATALSKMNSPNCGGLPTVRKLSWGEIEKATKNFGCVIGYGGFSTIYRGVLADGTLCAVKVIAKSERLRQMFRQELYALLRTGNNNNFVNLIGYCDDREEGVLVLEYVANGNLHDLLHGEASNELLPWNRRVRIAYEIASALKHLHEVCDPPIIHCDIKSSNILLDDDFNAKLCDFGFSKTGNINYLSKNSYLMGSPGYMDPHCLQSGIVCAKNDVYGFGVILLELLTGMEAFCGENRELLAVFASPHLKNPTKLNEMVDPRLGRTVDWKEVESMASIAALCINMEPQSRPSMSEILTLMNEKL